MVFSNLNSTDGGDCSIRTAAFLLAGQLIEKSEPSYCNMC